MKNFIQVGQRAQTQLQNLGPSGYVYCIVHIYPQFTRKRIASLYFGRDVRTRLRVAHLRGVWATCLSPKGRGVPLSALPKDTTSELAGLFSTTSHKCRAPSREAVDTTF